MYGDSNVIFIVGDGLRTHNLGCYGYPKPTSPFIDKLAREGVVFEDIYACSNHTDPSFTTIFSGRYPITHGITHHDFRAKRYTLEEAEIIDKTGTIFLPEILKEKGYITVAFDWLGLRKTRSWHRRGFDFYGEAGCEARDGKPDGGCYVDSAIQFINYFQKYWSKHKFFMLIHSWDTHTPFDNVPKSLVNQFYEHKSDEEISEMLDKIDSQKWKEIAGNYHLRGIEYVDQIPAFYDAAVALFDSTVNNLIRCLEELEILDNTVIVTTGDHGDNKLRDGIFVGHFGLYDPVIHVPLIMVGPGIPKNKRINGFVQHIDIFPTILDILGIQYRKYQPDGKSLLPLMREEKESSRSSVLTIDGAARRRYAIRTDNYKYIYSPTPDESLVSFDTVGCKHQFELYDLKKDPDEKENIIEEEPDKAENLQRTLLSKISELEEKKLRLIRKNENKRIKGRIRELKELGKI